MNNYPAVATKLYGVQSVFVCVSLVHSECFNEIIWNDEGIYESEDKTLLKGFCSIPHYITAWAIYAHEGVALCTFNSCIASTVAGCSERNPA